MEKNRTLTDGPIFSSLIRFAVPVLLTLFLQALYGGVDLLVVGQFAHTADVSGVATGSMLLQTYTVAAGAASLSEAIKLFWTFRVPWDWAHTAGSVPAWVAQFSFGFYSLMLTSTLIGLIVMVLYRPRSWCAFCPMGTMTQGICKLKNRAG